MERNAPAALLLKEGDLPRLIAFYQEEAQTPENPLILFSAKGDGFLVSVYRKSHSGCHKVLFQGQKADQEASLWRSFAQEGEPAPLMKRGKALRKDGYRNLYPQIGSDEVGTGDFFGPVCVVASYVERKDLVRLQELGVTDSKKMEDDHILGIGPILVKEFPYSSLSLSPHDYNLLYQRGENLNSIKAKMHNRALLNLKRRFPSAFSYMDQFAEEGLYYSYLKDEKEVLPGIVFKTKGELSFPSVALSSVLARYSFLRKMEEMGQKEGFPFPFGAGPQVEEAGRRFVLEKGKEELSEVAKLNFKTAGKILS